MNCYQMKMLLPSFEDDELSEEERETVYLHLATCANCRSALESIRALRRQLSLLQTISVDSEITDSVLSRIRRMSDTSSREIDGDPREVEPSQPEKSRTALDGLRREADRSSPLERGDDRLLPGWTVLGDP